MSTKKKTFSLLIAFIFIAAQVLAVNAAPVAQEADPTVISGTIVAINLDVDEETDPPTTTVLVTFEAMADEFPLTYRLSVETAVDLELVSQDPDTGEITVNEDMVGEELDLDPATVEETVLYGTLDDVVIEVATDDDDDNGDDNGDDDNGDTSGTTTVLVTVTDPAGMSHTLRLSIETALELELVTQDPASGEYSVNPEKLGEPVQIDPDAVLPDVVEDDDEDQDDEDENGEDGANGMHPVAEALAKFFSSLLGVDYDMVKGYHDEGFGFGVMAQALWMSYKMEGDAALFSSILDAKKSGDYSSLPLPEGVEVTNWGQFKKAVGKAGNLGKVMSGKADAMMEDEMADTESTDETQEAKQKGPSMKPDKAEKENGRPVTKPEKSNNGKAKGKNK